VSDGQCADKANWISDHGNARWYFSPYFTIVARAVASRACALVNLGGDTLKVPFKTKGGGGVDLTADGRRQVRTVRREHGAWRDQLARDVPRRPRLRAHRRCARGAMGR
jgi:hypothetical protein